MAAGYIQYDFHQELSQQPTYAAVRGAIDSHVHVFYPHLFPYSPEASYQPNAMTHDMMVERNRVLGLNRERYLAVGATPTGNDNSTILYAFEQAKGSIRSIATVRSDVSDEMLDVLQAGGVVGIRYVWVSYLKKEFTPPEDVIKMAERVAKRGWVVEVYFEGKDFDTLLPHLKTVASLTKVDIDHMGRPNVKGGAQGENYSRFGDQMGELLTSYPSITVKVSGHERLTEVGGDYSDSAAYGRALVRDHIKQVVWGSDSPHPNMTKTFEGKMPGDARLVNMIAVVAPAREEQRIMLVENPEERYFSNENKVIPVTPGLYKKYMELHRKQYGPT